MSSKFKGKKRRSSGFFIVMYALVFLSLVGLSFLRFHVSQIEQALSDMGRRIDSYNEEEIALGRDFSALTSPSQIYNYWKNVLGMDQVKQEQLQRVRVFQEDVPNADAAGVSPFPPSQGWRSKFFSLLGLSAN